jgi:hypothetical protein
MALTKDLPVFAAANNLLANLYVFIAHMPRTYRYSIGEQLSKGMLDVMEHIYCANSSTVKTPHLKTARERLERVRIVWRMTHDLHLAGIKRFVDISGQIENVSKQLAGWEKAQQRREAEQEELNLMLNTEV